jgi:predicted ester cyclase
LAGPAGTEEASTMTDDDLRERRLDIVRRHMRSENEQDFATTLATFEHPRYELVATGQVFDGPEEVAGYYRTSRAAFPDQRNDDVVLTSGDDTVVAEFDLLGTHRGPLGGLAPTGRTFRCRMCALFLFAPHGDRIIGERVYFDQGTILRQLTAEPGGPDYGPVDVASSALGTTSSS